MAELLQNPSGGGSARTGGAFARAGAGGARPYFTACGLFRLAAGGAGASAKKTYCTFQICLPFAAGRSFLPSH